MAINFPLHAAFRPEYKHTHTGFVGLNIGGKTQGFANEFAYESDGLFNKSVILSFALSK